MGNTATNMYDEFVSDGMQFRGDDSAREKLTRIYACNKAEAYNVLQNLANTDDSLFSKCLEKHDLCFPDESDMASWIDGLQDAQAKDMFEALPSIMQSSTQ